MGSYSKSSLNIAVVCGDGLPISGLLTTFRNVVDIVKSSGVFPALVNFPLSADLGYSWRPDKASFFPRGPKNPFYPSWLTVSDSTPVEYSGFGDDLLRIRREVAQPEQLSSEERGDLHRRIEDISRPYQRYFEDWFENKDIDWVIAINMALSDAVPVTLALHRAAANRWGCGRPGGVVFWDHDLFHSYAVHENEMRVYPPAPNEFTPIPQNYAWHVWVVVSDLLAGGATLYNTKARPLVVPNVLPQMAPRRISSHEELIVHKFLSERNLRDAFVRQRSILLCPVRIFPVKGIEISILLFASIKREALKRGVPVPYLLIFGDPAEDPQYAAELYQLASAEQVTDDIRFLEGVPLSSGDDGTRALQDEIDLLRICAATHGGVLFTPKVADVESVGLGPALAAIAGVPCVVSEFNAFHQVYGENFRCIRLAAAQTPEDIQTAAEAFLDLLLTSAMNSGTRCDQAISWALAVEQNKILVMQRFPSWPWKDLLLRLAIAAGVTDEAVLALTAAFRPVSSNVCKG
jgi:glycosyltransferase involved in cell wall biosynthesis